MTAPAATRYADSVTHYQMYIDGAWTDGQAPGRMREIVPANRIDDGAVVRVGELSGNGLLHVEAFAEDERLR